jgi:phospholipid/cholesterol/gamma-HCH transport system substrate-binding protein
MARNRQTDVTRSATRLRFTDEWVGLLVLGAFAIVAAAAFEAGVLKQWLHPAARLILLLPQNNTAGLSLGADIDVIGIHAGTIRRIKLNPNGEMYAVADIDDQAKPFIRRDSHAVISRRFVVAGATYIDISRGRADPLDWSYAVLQATAAEDPIVTITATLAEIRAKVLPTLDSAEAAVRSLQAVASGLQAGHGTVGKLLTDDTVITRAEQSLSTLDNALAQLAPIEARAGSVVGHADKTLVNLQATSATVRQAATSLPAIASNAAATTANLPALITQTQVTAEQLRLLLVQLRGSWLLGGGKVAPTDGRLPPDQVSP